MAEETYLLVAPQKNMLAGKNSVEQSVAKTNHMVYNGSATHPLRVSLRSSSHGHSSGRSYPGKLNTPTPNYKQDVSPRYHRASMGSCHDLCKYGRRVTDEPKPWRSLSKRNRKPPVDILVSKKTPVSVERMKATSMKHMHGAKALSGGLNLRPYNVTVSDEPPEIIERAVLSSPAKVELSSKGSETGNSVMGSVIKSPDTSTNDLSIVQPKVIPVRSASSDASKVITTVTGSNLDESSVNRDGSTSLHHVEIISSKSLSGPLSSHGCNQVEDEKIDVEEKGNDDDDDDDGAALTINKTTMMQNGKEIVKGSLVRKSQTKGDEDSSLRKLKFHRGRTIELQSDNNGPRKLKFRRGKVLTINQDNKVDGMKNLKKKALTNKVGVNSKTKKVVLRHRGMESKKDAQGLFNNVIEETASKLVKSRNSKVKALVGAFETVISLQDCKSDS